MLIGNEVLDSKMRSDEQGVICKLDIEKTSDYVNWNLLLYVINRMIFGDKWRRWIWRCISKVYFGVLVNGNSVDSFPSAPCFSS